MPGFLQAGYGQQAEAINAAATAKAQAASAAAALAFGGPMGAASTAAMAAAAAGSAPAHGPLQRQPLVTSGNRQALGGGLDDESSTGGLPAAPSAVRLRGLPFSATEQDVLAFFGQHDVVDLISEGPKAVNLLLRPNGRPSGQAVVQMRSRKDAEVAESVLGGQWMGSRYIEVFPHGDDENGGAAATSGGGVSSSNQPPAATAAAPPWSSIPSPWSSAGGLMPETPVHPETSWEALFQLLGAEGVAAVAVQSASAPQLGAQLGALSVPGPLEKGISQTSLPMSAWPTHVADRLA